MATINSILQSFILSRDHLGMAPFFKVLERTISQMQIPLVDLKVQYQSIKQEIMAAIEDVLEGMQLFLGPQSQAFEHEFAQCCGSRYSVGLSNGTDALTLALRACNIGPGDEAITVANTFIATVEAIALVGA